MRLSLLFTKKPLCATHRFKRAKSASKHGSTPSNIYKWHCIDHVVTIKGTYIAICVCIECRDISHACVKRYSCVYNGTCACTHASKMADM